MLDRNSIQTIEGSRGLRLDEVVHGMIPGRGRAPGGTALPPVGLDRVDYAGNVYEALLLDLEDGKMIVTGDRNPSDSKEGPSESALMTARLLLGAKVRLKNIVQEYQSIDTATNFTRSQSKFPDEQPVAIFAQEQHLERIIDRVAPKTMRRDYIGVVVPVNPEHPDEETLASAVFSKIVLLGVNPNMSDVKAIQKTDFRARKLWSIIKALHLNQGKGSVYDLDQQR